MLWVLSMALIVTVMRGQAADCNRRVIVMAMVGRQAGIRVARWCHGLSMTDGLGDRHRLKRVQDGPCPMTMQPLN